MDGNKANELTQAEGPARELLQTLGYTYVPRAALAAEREHEREVLLKAPLRRALLRLNDWLSEDQADQVIFKLQHVDGAGMARNQAIHEIPHLWHAAGRGRASGQTDADSAVF